MLYISILESIPTSQFYWGSSLAAALLDLGLVWVLIRKISPARFAQLLYPLIRTASITWGLIYTGAVWVFWLNCYQAVFPDWVRGAAPVYGLSLGVVAWLFWSLARRLPPHPVITFCVLGGLFSLPGHMIGIYGLGLLSRCRLLSQVSPASALTFGIFEFIFYWGVILGGSHVLHPCRSFSIDFVP